MSDPRQVAALAQAVSRCERECGLVEGSTLLLPNIETARGLVAIAAIAGASLRVETCLIGSEDLAADFGAERGADGIELAYARQRFLLECVAVGVVAVDCPYTWRDADGLATDTRWARRPDYKAKSAVVPEQAATINRLLTPTGVEVDRARRVHEAFAAARRRGSAHRARRIADRKADGRQGRACRPAPKSLVRSRRAASLVGRGSCEGASWASWSFADARW